MENRFKEDPRLGLIIACVGRLIESIATRDRWQIARNTTGPLLEELLAGQSDDRFSMGERYSQPGLEGVPIAVADNRVALVVGAVKTGIDAASTPVTAVLVAAPEHPRRWLVAALDFDLVVDNDFQRYVQFGAFSEKADLAVIAAHGTLDPEASAIDWDNPDTVLRERDNGVFTVADAVAGLSEYKRSTWGWIAEDRVMFSSLYLRAKYPGLVRDYPLSTSKTE